MKTEQIALLIGALVVGAAVQQFAQSQASALGLSTVEFALLAALVGAAARRRLA